LQCCLGFVRRPKNGLQSTDLRLTNMRSLESRIVKLETKTARPDEMLVVWRKPDGDVAEALKGVTFAKQGDLR
jgi:hypothetical protein